jgi:hypothetical protein
LFYCDPGLLSEYVYHYLVRLSFPVISMGNLQHQLLSRRYRTCSQAMRRQREGRVEQGAAPGPHDRHRRKRGFSQRSNVSSSVSSS